MFSNSRITLGTIGYYRYIHFSSRLGEYQTFIRRFSRSLLHGYTTTLQRKLVNPNHPTKDPSHPSQLDVVKYLTQSFASHFQSHQSDDTQPPASPYHPSLAPLYSHFITLLTDICFPFIHNPYELQYIAAARWPGFVKPVLDEYERELELANEGMDLDMMILDEEGEIPKPTFTLPSEHTRMRLNRLFSSSLTNALESLHPRLSNATDWALSNQPEPDLLSKPFTHTQQHRPPSNTFSLITATGANALPRISKFILVASFLASTNPPKSDIRMFGRGLDEKKRKRRIRRVGGGGRKVKADGTLAAVKVKKKIPLLFFIYLSADYLFWYRIDPTKIFRSHRFRIR